MKHTAEDVAYATKYIRSILDTPTPTELASVMVKVSRSGLQRRYVLLACSEGRVERISWAIATVTGMRLNRDDQSIVVNGWGFNGTQEITESLNRALNLNCTYREL